MIRNGRTVSRIRPGRSEIGVTTMEYAVMLVLIGLAVAAFGIGMSGVVTGVFSQLVKVLALAS